MATLSLPETMQLLTNTEKLVVREKVYLGDKVPDGFFNSMTALNSCDTAASQDRECTSLNYTVSVDFPKQVLSFSNLNISKCSIPNKSNSK